MAGSPAADRHGGNRIALARELGCRPDQLLDASASLVPFPPPRPLLTALQRALRGEGVALRDYPDRTYTALRTVIAAHHRLDPAAVLPGNGAAELLTWVARDAAAAGTSWLPSPGFGDYRRALDCWGAAWQPLPLPDRWSAAFPQPLPLPGAAATEGGVLWLTNPHNPTGQLWSRASLAPLLERFALVVVDEAFLPLVSGGERESLVPLIATHPNLVVLRSLTKLFAIAGLRLGYALAQPQRLARWSAWRDPWPVNGLAALAGEVLLADPVALARWLERVQGWVVLEGGRLSAGLAALEGLVPLPSAANFLLVRGERAGQPLALEPLRLLLQQQHRVLLRDCRSFEGLGDGWLRIALLDRPANRRLLRALAAALPQALAAVD